MRRFIRYTRDWYVFARWLLGSKSWQDLKSRPLRVWLKLLHTGFFLYSYQTYRLDKWDRKLFLNDRQNIASSRIDGQYGIILHDKLMFALVMHRFVRVPQTLALIRHGKPILMSDEDDVDLHRLIRREGKVIIKPVDKNGGRGIHLLAFREGRYWRNEHPSDESDFHRTLFESGHIIVTEYVRQGAFANMLYPNTVNTIRMLTLLDPLDHAAFVAGAVMRIGSAASVPVDNFSSGGMFCCIDLESGRLGKAATKPEDDRPLQWRQRHPDTKVVFNRQVIPDWQGISDAVLDLASKFPMLPQVAWDIAILDDGITIIEGNRWSGVFWFQLRRPFLVDPRIRRFYAHHGVI